MPKLVGTAGNDILVAGTAYDELQGLGGDDRLLGDNGKESLIGGDGNDWLSGGNGNDALNGADGNDILVGGAGADTLTGGVGDDVFVFDGSFGSDTITDFAAGLGRTDRIWITGAPPSPALPMCRPMRRMPGAMR